MIQNDSHFFSYMLFSDEAKFYSDGELNRQNCYYWSDVNPHLYKPVDHQNRWSFMVWCGIVNGYLIGAYFFEKNVAGYAYLELLTDHLPGLLENVVLETRLRKWLQQDGTAPHFAIIVRDFLNKSSFKVLDFVQNRESLFN